jgi:antitoxin VapB
MGMTDTSEAKLFMHGRSQAVRLPEAFRMPGTSVRVRRVGNGLLLEPMAQAHDEIRLTLDALAAARDVPFMPQGREQPSATPSDDVAFDR